MALLEITNSNHITTLTLNRAETMNPLGAAGDGDAFFAACDAINADMDVRCVILTGAGRAFSAGGDVKATATTSTRSCVRSTACACR